MQATVLSGYTSISARTMVSLYLYILIMYSYTTLKTTQPSKVYHRKGSINFILNGKGSAGCDNNKNLSIDYCSPYKR